LVRFGQNVVTTGLIIQSQIFERMSAKEIGIKMTSEHPQGKFVETMYSQFFLTFCQIKFLTLGAF